jgi:carboxylesterase type B
MMRVPNLRVADAHAAHRPRATYVYRFDWEAPGLGAAHAVDVPFTFGTFDLEGWGAVVGHDARAETLGAVWRGAWTRFAASGKPAEDWTPYDERRSTLLFGGTGAELVHDPAAETRRCWMT